MTAPRRPLVAGNWKMNGLKPAAAELGKMVAGATALPGVDLLVCPPATLLMMFVSVTHGSKVAIGAQDCHAEPSGAFTGDISAEMLADAGATAVIVGHSERRTYHHETDSMVRGKALAAWRAGLTAIVCVGETKDQRTAKQTLDVVGAQLAGSLPGSVIADGLVIAYEPVWAIGTGLTPTPADVAEVHGFIRERLKKRFGETGDEIRVLYGGSVKPSNAKELLGVADVDGALARGSGAPAPLGGVGEASDGKVFPGLARGGGRAGRRREPQGRGFPRDRSRLRL